MQLTAASLPLLLLIASWFMLSGGIGASCESTHACMDDSMHVSNRAKRSAHETQWRERMWRQSVERPPPSASLHILPVNNPQACTGMPCMHRRAHRPHTLMPARCATHRRIVPNDAVEERIQRVDKTGGVREAGEKVGEICMHREKAARRRV